MSSECGFHGTPLPAQKGRRPCAPWPPPSSPVCLAPLGVCHPSALSLFPPSEARWRLARPLAWRRSGPPGLLVDLGVASFL